MLPVLVLVVVLDNEEPATVELATAFAAPPAPTVDPPLLPIDVPPLELELELELELKLVAGPVLPTMVPAAVVALVELASALLPPVSSDVSPIPEAVVAAVSP